MNKVGQLILVIIFGVACHKTSYIYISERGGCQNSPKYYRCISSFQILYIHKYVMKLAEKEFGKEVLRGDDTFQYTLRPVYQNNECDGVYLYGTYFPKAWAEGTEIPVLCYKSVVYTSGSENIDAILAQFLAECIRITPEKEAQIRKLFKEKRLFNILKIDFRN